MSRRYGWILLLFALIAAWSWWRSVPAPSRVTAPTADTGVNADRRGGQSAARTPSIALPDEARDTLRRIQAGGPFAYRQDGSVFHNREGLLPQRDRGYYREYTVTMLRARDRGARRIVAGGDPPTVFYYTADHYRSFRRVDIVQNSLR